VNRSRHIVSAVVTLLALLMVLLAGCSGPGGLKRADPLAGTAWMLARLDDAPALEGVQVTLQFDEGRVGGSAGCNQYGGDYAVDKQELTMGPLASTLMACAEQAAMSQEGRYLQALGQVESFELVSGGLRLHGAGGVTLVFEPAE
jgi:heat shock protein HslJ